MQHVSLVKYNTPILVSGSKASKGAKDGAAQSKGSSVGANTTSKSKKSGTDAKAAGAPAATTQTEDILNSILPPREWTEEGQLWVQYVSSTPATRIDVINLQEELDKRLQLRQARETGICPIREELYAQTFDELIREVTINCAERGLLLLRVRDEIRMTIAAYQTLYESSIAFGMRKALQAEQKKADLETRLDSLNNECSDLESQVTELADRIAATEQREADRRAAEEAKHKEELDFMKKHNASLKEQLESLLSSVQAAAAPAAPAAGAKK